MSHAWEVTAEDVAAVLAAHGVAGPLEAAEPLHAEVLASADNVEAAVLCYDSMDDQAAAALAEIEAALRRLGAVPEDAPVRFRSP